jgi:hypothetical protein
MLSKIVQARPCSLVPVYIDAAEQVADVGKRLAADMKREL